jgi:phage terminase large subunit-like protein
LVFAITTAGFDRHSICYKQREYAMRVLNGTVDDPAYLPIIYGMDEDDDWENEDNWRAVNPSMDTIFSFESFKKDFLEAKEMPHKQNLFRRLRLNQWTRQETRYLPMDKWYSAPRRSSIDELRGELCYVGLDLAAVMDIAALLLVFPPSEKRPYWDVIPYFFVPSMAIDVRAKRDRVPYDQWVRDGFLIATPGNTIDYERIQEKILEAAGIYKVANLGYDRAFAIQIIQNIESEGIETTPVGMGFLSMASPMKELLRLVMNGQLRHGNNPVFDWMAENLAVKTDAAGNVKPAKDASSEKIDGIVALCCALFVANAAEIEGPSCYETMGVERLQVAVGHDVETPEVVRVRTPSDSAIAARYGG